MVIGMDRVIENQRGRFWPLFVLAGTLGCTRTPPPVADVPERAIKGSHAPESPQPKPDPKPAPHVRRDPKAVADSIGRRWCEKGGEQFAPPGGDPDDYPPPLSSCADVTTDVSEIRQLGETAAAILEVDAIFESRELLLVQDGGGEHTIELAHDFEDESGEAGEYTRTYDTVELRDVYGDASPEWIATTTTTGGDSFEADRCYAHDSTVTTLIVCSVDGGALKCMAVNTVSHDFSRPRAADQLYDCEDRPPKDDTTRSGYALQARVEPGAVVFSPLSKPAMTEPEAPPYNGRVSLDTLFDEQPL